MEAKTHSVKQQRQLPGVPSVNPGQEAKPKASEGYTVGRGLHSGHWTGVRSRLPRQGQVLGCEGCMPTGAGQDRKFCTQGTTP